MIHHRHLLLLTLDFSETGPINPPQLDPRTTCPSRAETTSFVDRQSLHRFYQMRILWLRSERRSDTGRGELGCERDGAADDIGCDVCAGGRIVVVCVACAAYYDLDGRIRLVSR